MATCKKEAILLFIVHTSITWLCNVRQIFSTSCEVKTKVRLTATQQGAVKASNSPRDWTNGVRMTKKINESGQSVSHDHMFTRSHASKITILWHISKSEWELLDCHVNFRFMALYIYARFDSNIPCFAVTGIFIKQIWFVKKTLALIA